VSVRARGPLQRTPVLTAHEEIAFIEQALRDAGARLDDVGLVLVGANGDPDLDAIYAEVGRALVARTPSLAVGVYRQLTGDFATASALGLELAVRVASGVTANEVCVVDGSLGAAGAIRRVLLYHVTTAGYHSAMIVSV
jgi:hypothetical protein